MRPAAQVIATGGDAKLGGDDFTSAAVSALTAKLPTELQQLLQQGRSVEAWLALFGRCPKTRSRVNITMAYRCKGDITMGSPPFPPHHSAARRGGG